MAIGASPAPERHAPIDLDLISEAESSIAAPAPKARLAPKHRIALPKHEGSRRRRRWENDHFYLTSPLAAPPVASDWLPLHPPHRPVPYHYANLLTHPSFPQPAAPPPRAPTVPAALKTRLKRAPGALDVLEKLERDIREFMLDERVTAESESDTDGEEIVFIGRGRRECVVITGAEGDAGGAFERWLVHELALYYGLRSWSVSEEGRRGVWIARGKGGDVPRPLHKLLRV